jgi:quercetin dioxygenase-like cupin family protein
MTVATFIAVTDYWGAIAEIEDVLADGKMRRSIVYGFENLSAPRDSGAEITHESGSVFGCVTEGTVTIRDRTGREPMRLQKGDYFSLPSPLQFSLEDRTRVVAVHPSPFTALRQWGGPIEEKGRLRYIDRCSDTLLIAPPRLGDPCLNLLHFPPGIHQTAHTHPSVRCGAIANGSGYCINGEGAKLPLEPGMVWIIPAGTVHSFHTADSNQTMNVIAYHPDSDFGPEDEAHPMINRTWVDGAKIDNTGDEHADADMQDVE